ncbi:MAG: hypothetical protein ACEQSK_20835, partial [Sphingomonadaceae bacterium]
MPALRRHRRSLLLLLLAAVVGALPAAAAPAAPAPLVLAISANAYHSVQGPWLELIYREAFRRLGRPLRIEVLPSKRASVMADAGLVDGELHRAAVYADSHPQLRRVEVSHFAVQLAAYSQHPDLTLTAGWDSFNQTRWRVDYILGSAASSAELTRRVAPAQLSTVTAADLGLRKLMFDRSDVLLAVDLNVDPLLGMPEFRASPIRKVAELQAVPCYPYLHQRHAALVPQLEQVLLQMRQEGLPEQYGRQARTQWQADYLR